MTMVALGYAITPEDFASYSVYVHLEAPGKSRWKRWLPALIIVIIVFGANILNGVISGHFGIAEIFPVVMIFGLYLLIAGSFGIKQRVKKAAALFSANPLNNLYFQMTEYTFSDTGVIIKDDVKETRLRWKAFVKKQETAAYIFLFVTASSAYIIPKRVFKSEVQKEELDRIFRQCLSFDAEIGHLVKE